MTQLVVRPRSGLNLLALLRRQRAHVPSDCGGHGTCGKCRVRVLDRAGARTLLACQHVPDGVLTVELPEPGPAARARARPHPVDPRLALAADIGTTTISLAAVDTALGRVARRRTVLNPQLPFGADVMTRISQRRPLRRIDLLAPLRSFMASAGIGRGRELVAVGNTAIIHFLLGRSPAGLGTWPYRSRVELGRPARERRGGLRLWVPPLLDSFVGADCTAAVIASGMHRRPGLELLVDAGTNGEVVLGSSAGLYVCSTAAGPAFEGATLECGSLAVPGAVRRVRARGRRLVAATIGNRPARSVCGSGVLSATRAALGAGLLDPSGRLENGDRLTLAPGVWLSQADIREVQLAVAALGTGIRLLLLEAGRTARDITRVHLTGRFGAAIEPDDAVAIGLLPRIGARIRRHPNLALKGAVRFAADPASRREAAAVAALSRPVTLSGHREFEARFIEAMRLAPWQ